METLIINNNLIFAFSDTHGYHRDLLIPMSVDILICAGDAVEDDLKDGKYDDFIDWFSSLPAKWKIFIPGNHELSFDRDRSEPIEKAMALHGILVLQNAVTNCDGVTIGSIDRDVSIKDEDIPTDLDILVTHFPPFGIIDDDFGSPEILNFMMKSKPAYHLFGHVHSTERQEFRFGETLCVNVGKSQLLKK